MVRSGGMDCGCHTPVTTRPQLTDRGSLTHSPVAGKQLILSPRVGRGGVRCIRPSGAETVPRLVLWLHLLRTEQMRVRDLHCVWMEGETNGFVALAFRLGRPEETLASSHDRRHLPLRETPLPDIIHAIAPGTLTLICHIRDSRD